MCVSPYIATRKDGTPVCVPCGKCIECRKQWQTDWIFRLSQEVKRVQVPIFLTLTYNDENLPLGDVDLPFPEVETLSSQSVLVKSDLQKFFKRLRKNGGDTLRDCRYFAIGEYGSRSNRCHYHAIIIAPHLRSVADFQRILDKSWTLGFSLAKLARSKQIHYVCKYMNKLDRRPHLVKPFRLYSRSLGLSFLSQKMIDYYLSTFDRTCISGKCRISLPRYYKKKLDDLSETNYLLKKAGLTYSDLLEDVKPVPGTKYYFFKEFTENYEWFYQLAKEELSVNGVLIQPLSRQTLFRWYVRHNKLLSDAIAESFRLIECCVIRNKLEGLQEISDFMVNLKEDG